MRHQAARDPSPHDRSLHPKTGGQPSMTWEQRWVHQRTAAHGATQSHTRPDTQPDVSRQTHKHRHTARKHKHTDTHNQTHRQTHPVTQAHAHCLTDTHTGVGRIEGTAPHRMWAPAPRARASQGPSVTQTAATMAQGHGPGARLCASRPGVPHTLVAAVVLTVQLRATVLHSPKWSSLWPGARLGARPGVRARTCRACWRRESPVSQGRAAPSLPEAGNRSDTPVCLLSARASAP